MQQVLKLSGLADWSGLALPMRPRGKFNPDKKHVLAVSGVLVMHTLLFGAMMLPIKPLAPDYRLQTPPPELWVDTTILPPPPKKPPPAPNPTTKPLIQAAIPRSAAPAPPIPLDQPVFIAATAEPSEEIDGMPRQTIVAPSTDSGTDLGMSMLKVLDAPGPPFNHRLVKNDSTVEFSVLVGANGKALQIRLDRTSGNSQLDRSTLSFVKRKWRFKPLERAGKAVESWGRGKVTFKLEG